MNAIQIYVAVAIFSTLFYGLGAFAVWGNAEMPFAHRLHQYWFNIAGSAVGWLAGWPVLHHWFLLEQPPTFVTVALLPLAFVGVTGHLPQLLAFWGLTRRSNLSPVRQSIPRNLP